MKQQGLILRDFSSGYARQKVIDHLNLSSLPPGEISVLLGPNGCGKSTLMRALAGLNSARGEMWLNGDNLLQQPPSRRAQSVVYLPQSLPAGVHLQVLESILVAQRASGSLHSIHSEAEVMNLLEQLGIASLAMCYLDQLSGGQKQLVGLAQSLIRRPALLLLDEPLSALDLNYQFHVMDLVRRETAQRNTVTLVVVHDINIALRHAQHALMLKQGKLVAQGEPDKVITPETLAEVYGVLGRIEHCSRGLPQVMIDGLVPEAL
jgi:iron complex transport system ATP-binding protein